MSYRYKCTCPDVATQVQITLTRDPNVSCIDDDVEDDDALKEVYDALEEVDALEEDDGLEEVHDAVEEDDSLEEEDGSLVEEDDALE